MDDDAIALIGDAAAPYALITSAQRYIGTIVMDVTVREVHSDEDTVTVHPVETGTPVSDHIFANPQILEIVCAVSDSTAGYSGYAQAVYEEFRALKATRQAFDISTGKRFYTSMVFGNITVVTDDASEFALMVTVRCQQVIMTDSSSTASTSADAGYGGTQDTQDSPQDTAPQQDAGTQAPQPAPSVQPTAAEVAAPLDPGQGGGAGFGGGSGGSPFATGARV